MKQLSMALLALAVSLPALAQKSRVSLNLYSLSAALTESEDPDMPGKSETKSITVLPAIGYHRIIKGNTGIGLELGYNRSRVQSDNTYQPASAIGFTRYEDMTTGYDEFYACPSLFQVITTANRKYRFIPSIGVPVRYIPEQKSVQHQRTINQETGALATSSSYESASLRTLRIGLLASAAAQIRIAGGFYAGLQFGAGINYSRQRSFGESVTINSPGLPYERRTVLPVTKNLNQGLSFEFQPAISLNYFF